MLDWVQPARDALAAGPAALVTILATEGSAPRGAGTRMVVTPGGTVGTIGGGALEHQAIMQARALLGAPAVSWRIQDYPLGPLLGQCCGGRVRLLVERLDKAADEWLGGARAGRQLTTGLEATRVTRVLDTGDGPLPPPSARGERPGPGTVLHEVLGEQRRPLLLFGAGHVGRAIVYAGSGLPLALAWFDTREELAATDGLTIVPAAAIAACAAAAAPGDAVLILTHDHALDYALTRAALGSAAAFVGLIGSATKRARFVARLEREGVDSARLTCPIGLPGISGKAPAVIAIAVLAQLLALGAP